MALTYTPITELEAVNTLLSTIGETPVSTIPSSGVSDASEAQAMLHRVNRQVQGMGLKFNSDYKVQLSPDTDGKINIATNVIRVEPYYRGSNYDYAVRGRYLWDRYNQTYVFTSYVLLNMVYFLAWDQMPEHVRHYVTIKAARKFQADTVGSPQLDAFTKQDEFEARSEMMRWELIKKKQSFLESSGVYGIVNRRV